MVNHGGQARGLRQQLSGGLYRFPLFVLVWLGLTEGDLKAWGLGLVVAVLAAWASLALPGARPWRWKLPGLLAFIPFFLWHSLRGGVDVARRAYLPRLPLDPALVEHPLRLPDGPSRIFLVNTVNLLPGTLSAELRGNLAVIHMLDASLPAIRELQLLEAKVARLFGETLEGTEPS